MRWAGTNSPAHRLNILDLAERAARAKPLVPALQGVWAAAAESAGRREEALALFEQACLRFPDDDALHREFASALARAGRTGEALSLAGRWLGSGWARKLEFRLLLRGGRLEGLERREAALAESDPTDPDLLDFRARKWRDSPARLLEACEQVLARDKRALHAIYHKIVALAQLGRQEEGRTLMALDLYLQVTAPDAPAPFGSRDDFASALEREIRANPTLHPDPVGHATRKGLRTATFPLPEDRAGAALVRAIREAVDIYAARLCGDHPFVAARPEQAGLKSWALLFDGRGHQMPHFHPGPWLTGVYYVAAPRGGKRPGTLRIGALPEWVKAGTHWPIVDIEPVPGTLVLFPSFVPHETLPTGSDEARISVAFDVAGRGA